MFILYLNFNNCHSFIEQSLQAILHSIPSQKISVPAAPFLFQQAYHSKMDENHRYLVFSHIGFLPQAEWREAISTSSISHQMPLPFLKKKKYLFLIEGKDTCFTILCWFLPKVNMNQPQVYICPFPLKPLFHLPPLQLLQSPGLSSLSHTANSHQLSILHSVYVSMLLHCLLYSK